MSKFVELKAEINASCRGRLDDRTKKETDRNERIFIETDKPKIHTCGTDNNSRNSNIDFRKERDN